jgi:UDP-N-acetyl-D-mannosaminuronic acid transferase (WecB/TagA/CpsF family)
MNLQEIIEDADLLVPNSFPITRKVRWVNQIQRQLYREVPDSFSSIPQDLRDDQMTAVPRFAQEYHELFVIGAAKRIAERTQNLKLADELEARFQNLLLDAKTHLAPKLSKVTIKRSWM